MRRLAVCLACAFSAGLAAAGDDWSGRYRLEWLHGLALPPAQLTVAKAADADPARLVERYRADLTRWTLAGADRPADTALLRRFLPAEYVEFGWKDLFASGRIECLDAGRIFICRTAPGSTVTLGPDGPARETLLARTGVFGIALHAGAFELNKE